MGLWGSLVAFEVWDFATPVQIRVSPFILKCQQNQKKQNLQEDSEQDMVNELEPNLLRWKPSKELNKLAPTVQKKV